MRNSTKKGGAVKYQNGGSKKPMMMNPSKIAVGPTKKMTDAQKKAYMDKLKKQVQEGYKAPKKQMGGIIPSKPIATSPIQGKTGRRGAAGSNMAKGGQKFPDLTGDGKVTKKDILRGRGVLKKGGVKKYQPGGSKTAGQAYMKYVPNAVASDTLASQGDARFQQPYYEDDNFTAKKKMLQMTYGDETPDPQFGTERRQQTPQEVAAYEAFLKRMYGKKKGGQKHPGFKAVQSKIAAKQGVSKKAAGAILASATRKASAKAKAANPRLKRVKG